MPNLSRQIHTRFMKVKFAEIATISWNITIMIAAALDKFLANKANITINVPLVLKES